jgi:hypothetical protein
LKWKADVDESAHGLRGGFVLGVVKKVTLAGLESRMPFQDIKGRIVQDHGVFGDFFGKVGVALFMVLWPSAVARTTPCITAGGGGTAHSGHA